LQRLLHPRDEKGARSGALFAYYLVMRYHGFS
jgi:hypothetical protein